MRHADRQVIDLLYNASDAAWRAYQAPITIGDIERCHHGPHEACRCPSYSRWVRQVALDFDRTVHRFPRVVRRWAGKHK